MDDAPDERVSLRVIANKANVSRMTVSRSLRDDRSISKETRQRVKRIAKDLGYRADPSLARLMETIRIRKRERLPNVIAMLTAYDKRSGWRKDPTMRAWFEGAARQADRCGYKLEEFWVREPGMTDQRLSRIIRARGIEGVIVAPLPEPQLILQDFQWDWFSAVEVGYSLISPPLHRVCGHHFESMLLLMQKLFEAGHRRIGVAMKLHDDERSHYHWRGGHLTAQSLWGRINVGLMFVTADWRCEAFAHWLKRQRPDAVIAFGPTVGAWLRELGLRVPREIGLANLDVRLDAAGTTGIDRNPQLIGPAAINLLISLLHNQERGVPTIPRVTKVQGTFVQGRTTRRGLPAMHTISSSPKSVSG